VTLSDREQRIITSVVAFQELREQLLDAQEEPASEARDRRVTELRLRKELVREFLEALTAKRLEETRRCSCTPSLDR
jgi:hypothetical protein